jgi:tripartite-type tricarboxylate transporter receptor subunit TctC
MVVPYPAGGNTDFVARLTADYLGRELGKPVVVDNRAGAGGTIAATQVAKLPPDGYSLFLASIAQISLAPFLYKIRYNPIKDFLPIANVAGNPQVIVVPASSSLKTLRQLIDFGLANKDTLKMAHAGTGSMSFLAGAAFLKRANVEAIMVPYKGGAAAILDTVGGHTDVYTANISEILPYLQGEQLRILAVTSPQPITMLPGVPTVASIFPGFQTETWNGLFAPAGVSPQVAERLSASVSKMFSDEIVQAKMAKAGLIPQLGEQSTKNFSRRIQSDIDLWRPIIKSLDIKPE